MLYCMSLGYKFVLFVLILPLYYALKVLSQATALPFISRACKCLYSRCLFEHPPYGGRDMCPPFITSEMPDSHKRGVIVDLSFPEKFNVNCHVPKGIYLDTVFKLQ